MAYISSYKVDIPIKVFAKGPFIKRVVYTKTGTTLPSYSIATITVYYLDLPDRDFFFEPEDTKLSIYIGITNSELTSVLVKNDTEYTIRIYRNIRLEDLYKSDYNGCFPITSRQEDITELVIRRPREEYYNT